MEFRKFLKECNITTITYFSANNTNFENKINVVQSSSFYLSFFASQSISRTRVFVLGYHPRRDDSNTSFLKDIVYCFCGSHFVQFYIPVPTPGDSYVSLHSELAFLLLSSAFVYSAEGRSQTKCEVREGKTICAAGTIINRINQTQQLWSHNRKYHYRSLQFSDCWIKTHYTTLTPRYVELPS